MKKMMVVMLLALAGCRSTSMLESIGAIKQKDMEQAIAILTDQQDDVARPCVVFISNTQPIVRRILDYPTSGPFSVIAKRRALESLERKLLPEFEKACAPVLLDETRRKARYALLFRGA